MDAMPAGATLAPIDHAVRAEQLNTALDALVLYGLSGSDANSVDLKSIELSYFTFDVLEYIGWMQIFKPRGKFNNNNPLNDLRFLYEMTMEDNPSRAQIAKLRGVLRDQVYGNFRQWWRDCNAKGYNKVNTLFFDHEDQPDREIVRKYLNGYDPDYVGAYMSQWM